MSLENLRKRKSDIEIELNTRLENIQNLRNQITNAENTIKQWTDTVLLQRGQLIEIDNLIREFETEAGEDEEVKDKAE